MTTARPCLSWFRVSQRVCHWVKIKLMTSTVLLLIDFWVCRVGLVRRCVDHAVANLPFSSWSHPKHRGASIMSATSWSVGWCWVLYRPIRPSTLNLVTRSLWIFGPVPGEIKCLPSHLGTAASMQGIMLLGISKMMQILNGGITWGA